MVPKVVVLFLCFSLCVAAPAGQKIVGGVETTIEDVPYQLELQAPNYENEWTFFCGAVIIGETDVLTAATCLMVGVEYMRILSGATNHGNGTIHNVTVATEHPDFYFKDIFVPVNNIAYLKVTPPFNLRSNSTKAIKLTDKEPSAGEDAVVSGWGTKDWDDLDDIPSAIRKITVPVLSQEDCRVANFDDWYDEDSMICAGLPEGDGEGVFSCEGGDGGGPMVVNGTLAGLVSWGVFCGEPPFVGVYTNVNTFRSWINEQVEANKS